MRIEGSLPGMTPTLAGRSDAASAGAPSTGASSPALLASDTSEATLPPVKVLVTMVERLTGRPVRIIDASELNSLKLETPPPQRPAPLSSRPDWGVSLGVMDRGSSSTSSEATTVAARATVTAADGSRQDLTVSIALSSDFVADQRARVREGRSPMADPLLISVGSTMPWMKQGATTFELGLDPGAGVARLSVAPEVTPSNLAAEADSDRAAVSRTLDPAAVKNAAALSVGGAFASRPLVSPLAATGYKPLKQERTEAIKLDIAV